MKFNFSLIDPSFLNAFHVSGLFSCSAVCAALFLPKHSLLSLLSFLLNCMLLSDSDTYLSGILCYAMLCFGSFQVLVIHKDSSIPTVSGYIQQNLGCRVSCRTSLEVAFCYSGELFSDQIYIFEVVYFRQISEFAYKQSSC